MTKSEFLVYLHDGDFTSLFIECGWNSPLQNKAILIAVDGKTFCFREVAQKGLRIFACEVDAIPAASVRRLLDSKIRKYSHDYFVIFVLKGTGFHHLWSVPVNGVDKRQLVTVEYVQDSQAEFLKEKLDGITFGIDENVAVVDVIDRVTKAFLVNSEKVTKSFYRGFRDQHKAFSKGIENIPVKTDCEWYASVMLNRLMFCYFLQKKGFLDCDENYLGNKLKWVQEKRGENKFLSFYRSFLKNLFNEGLDKPYKTRSAYFLKTYGRIPYLNGGMFAKHELEKKYTEIDIPDSAFESLFRFFDEWRWHLDSRLTESGKDINPDVLGYIFEQYINDRAAMGAYYTKEDITEYITRNTLVPWLFNETAKKSPAAFKSNGYVWQMLRNGKTDSPLPADRYIFPAMRKGIDLPLPPEIEKGVSVEPQDTLRKRRAEWNKPASEEYALPTEIWRETVARRQRCQELRGKIAAGEITDINDFITYNLDIRKFAEDLLLNTSDHLFIRHFYEALCNVTVLDPTCGSGAFLFAALNILEPFYEICLTRMQEEWPEKFKDEITELKDKYRGNLKYCIYKNIILRNLYGVDIMHEATEIAKLRLFLKMVAVVDVDEAADNLGLDPLPDIDFNIRCGNTLVGYASEEEIRDGFTNGDMFAYAELKPKMETELMKVSLAQKQFRDSQLLPEVTSTDVKRQKTELERRLEDLKTILNEQLYERRSGKTKEEWLADSQPFHWYVDFFDIMCRGGFDVIVGNPPYVEKGSLKYSVKCTSCRYDNLYADCMERVRQLAHQRAFVGLIVPMSVTSIREYKNLRKFLVRENDVLLFTNHAIRPLSLFTGVSQRVSIVMSLPNEGQKRLLTTKYLRTNDTEILMQTISYCNGCLDNARDFIIPKMGSPLMQSALRKLGQDEKTIVHEQTKAGVALYYKDYGESYYIFPFCFIPWLTPVKSFKKQLFAEEQIGNIFGVTNSSLFYVFYITISDCWHFGNWHLGEFPCNVQRLNIQHALLKRLVDSYKTNRIRRFDKRAGGEIYEYKIGISKPIIDEIDEVLAKHYGFTEEELDFIINYDIKYRMGDKLNGEE